MLSLILTPFVHVLQTRLDINGPSFTAYHETLPGLFRD